MILIIGSAEEAHSKHMYEYIKNNGEQVKYLDTRTIPGNFFTSWQPNEPIMKGTIIIDGEKIKFENIKSVYWRWHYGINASPQTQSENDVYNAHMATREFGSFVESIFDALECKWVNSQKAIKMHRNKPYQLYLMGQHGIRVPKTLITTDKDELLDFVKNFDGELIFKPVRGGAHTQALSSEDLIPEKIELLKYCPVTFQEKLNGVDIRIYGIGDEFFAAEIRAKSLDFRDDHNAEIVPFELPESVKNYCLKIMELFDLKFTGIDVRYNAETNEYVFIEANPSPMFTYFEKVSGFPITQKLYELLADN